VALIVTPVTYQSWLLAFPNDTDRLGSRHSAEAGRVSRKLQKVNPIKKGITTSEGILILYGGYVLAWCGF